MQRDAGAGATADFPTFHIHFFVREIPEIETLLCGSHFTMISFTDSFDIELLLQQTKLLQFSNIHVDNTFINHFLPLLKL